MENAVSLEDPQVLLDLPKANSASVRQWIGSSFNIFSRRRRRRANLVVAVDGHGLNLYAANEPRLLATHVLPPQASFTAAPVFLHKRGLKGRHPAQRFACAAVDPGSGYGNHQLCFFAEDIKPDVADNITLNPTSRQTLDFGSRDDPTVFIDAIPVNRAFEDSSPPFDIIAVSRSGRIACHSGNFSKKIWSNQSAVMNGNISLAALYDADTLRRGFLEAHKDLMARISSPSNTKSSILTETYVLLTVISSPGPGSQASMSLNLDLLKPSGASLQHLGGVQRLVSWPLPQDFPEEDSSDFTVDVKNGHLRAVQGGRLRIIDLSCTKPTEISRICAQDGDFSSVTQMTGPLILAAGIRYLSIYDTYHKSLLARVETYRPTKQLKRKRSETASLSGPLRLIRYARSSGTLYGYTDSQLISVKVNLRDRNAQSGPLRPGRLADSLGKASNAAIQASSTDSDKKMADVLAQLTASLSDVQTFDKVFDEQVVHSQSLSVQNVQHISSYALCKIFAWVGQDAKKKFDTQPSLRVARMPRETFQWLTFKGYVTPQNLEHVLCHNTSSGVSLPCVSAHDLVEAISRFDQSLVLLSAWIELQPHPELDTYVQALQRLLQSFDADEPISDTKLISEGKETDEGEDAQMLEDAESAAERDLDAASTLLEDGMQIRAGAIKTCLSRLSRSFQHPSLSQSFRANMSQRDLTLLIDLLRVELSEDGWMARQMDPTTPEFYNAVPSEGLFAACTLLNSAIDAMGSAGILAGSYGIADEYDDAEEFLRALRQEVSAMIEGIQEATFFSGFLKDFLRFESVVAHTKPLSQDQSIIAAEGPQDRARIKARFAQDSVLPLGANTSKPMSATRIGAGGEIQRRSDRDIGNTMSKRLGQYTFETIRV